jgi:hypothetical protein
MRKAKYAQGGSALSFQVGQMSTWRTPQAQEGAKGNVTRGSQKHGHQVWLTEQVMASTWPTPTVADVEGGRKHRSGARSGELLLNGLAATEPTGPTQSGASAQTARRGALNPIFVFWLMGFPTEWQASALRAMQSFRKSRQK